MPAPPRTRDIFSTEHLYADLRARSVRGGVLTVSSQGIQFVVLSVATVVLARLLTPSDFGLVAMVTSITGLGQAFADLGLSEATIQRPEINHKQVSTLFWVNVAIGVVLTAIAASMAPLLSWFYRDPRIFRITLCVSITFLIGGLRVQHDALLKRQMRFKALVMRDMTSPMIAVPIAILIAWMGGGYWALVALPMTLNGVATLWSWALARWIPGLPSFNASIRSLMGFGGSVASSYLLLNIIGNTDNVLVGRYCGAGPLGLYSRAFNLLMLPVKQLSGPVGSVAVPAYSRAHLEGGRLARYYLRTVSLFMWLGMPVFGFLFVTAVPVITVVLGHQWIEAAGVFRLLDLGAVSQLLLNVTVWLLVGRGRADRLLRLVAFIAPVTIASYVIGLPFGIKGVALSGALTMLVILPWILHYSFRDTSLRLGQVGKVAMYPIIICVVAVSLSLLWMRTFPTPSLGLQFGTAAVCFGLTYGLFLLNPSVRAEVSDLFEILWNSLRSKISEA